MRPGVEVVAGAGYYVDGYYSDAALDRLSIDDMVDRIVRDVLEGIGDTGIKCGIIGEVGCSWPLRESERRSLIAAAHAQKETGVSISIHPARNEQSPLEIRDILEQAGADLTRVVMGHMDRCGYELSTRLDLIESGVVIEYDVFGMEGWYPAALTLAEDHLPNMPNDMARVREIADLIGRGHVDQIVVGHDIHMKFQLAKYGGWGFGHYLRNVVPLMEVYGIPKDVASTLTVSTPQRLLAIAGR